MTTLQPNQAESRGLTPDFRAKTQPQAESPDGNPVSVPDSPVPESSGPGLYVYGVVATAGHHVLGAIGLDGRIVYTIPVGEAAVPAKSLSALVHDCIAQPYQSDDSTTAQEWVLAHQRVIVSAGERFGTVLPMAFNTIVHGEGQVGADQALRTWLDQKRERFERLFRKLTGKAEYGVQVFWDRHGAIEEEVRRQVPDIRGLTPESRARTGPSAEPPEGNLASVPEIPESRGLAHLLRQKLLRSARQAVEAQASQHVKGLYTRICACVDDLRVDPLRKDSEDGAMLLNLSCLMDPQRRELGVLLDEIQTQRGFTVRFTGPWPPYSFVSL